MERGRGEGREVRNCFSLFKFPDVVHLFLRTNQQVDRRWWPSALRRLSSFFSVSPAFAIFMEIYGGGSKESRDSYLFQYVSERWKKKSKKRKERRKKIKKEKKKEIKVETVSCRAFSQLLLLPHSHLTLFHDYGWRIDTFRRCWWWIVTFRFTPPTRERNE